MVSGIVSYRTRNSPWHLADNAAVAAVDSITTR
jgi:hypothetical protein